MFDSVGFAIEDFSALRYLDDVVGEAGLYSTIDLLARPGDPRDLFGVLTGARSAVAGDAGALLARQA